MKRVLAERKRQEDEYRKALLDKQTELLPNLGLKFDHFARMGRVAEEDQAAITHEEFISLSRNRLDYEQLRLVEEALDRMDSGEFGICQSCGEPVAAKRLQAIPWARHCVGCENALGMAGLTDASPMPVPWLA